MNRKLELKTIMKRRMNLSPKNSAVIAFGRAKDFKAIKKPSDGRRATMIVIFLTY